MGFARRLLTEQPRPDRIRNLASAPWLAVGTVCVGAFMGQLDASIVTTALPRLRADLHTNIAAVEWVVLVYVLVLAGAVAAVGRLADRLGRKLLYTYGFAVFVAGSAACAVAPSLPVLVAARCLQAVGAVLLQANSYALIRDVLPDRHLGVGLGVQGAAQAVGLAAGPALGGALVALGGWRLIFLVNLPAGAIGLVLGRLLLPRSTHRDTRARLDPTGTVLLATLPAAILAALSFAAEPATPWWVEVGLVALAVALAVAAVLRQRRRAGSVIDPALARAGRLLAGLLVALLSYVVLFGTLFAVPFFLDATLRLDPARAGLELSVLPAGIALLAPVGGILRDRLGAPLPTGAGMGLAALGLGVLSAAAGDPGLLVPGLALIGLGMGLFIPANNASTMFGAPADRAGAVGGLLNMARGIGTALGVAMTGLLVARVSGGPGGAASLRLVAAVLAGVAVAAAAISVSRGASPARDLRPD